MVEELLGNSLDKAYGKQGNPCSPGWANSQAACLEAWMRAEPSVLCQGLSFPQHQQRQLQRLLEPGRCTWPRGCCGCHRVGCWNEGLQLLAQGGDPVQVGAAEHSVVLPTDHPAPQS